MTTMTRRMLLAGLGAGVAGMLTGCGGFALQIGRADRPAEELVLTSGPAPGGGSGLPGPGQEVSHRRRASRDAAGCPVLAGPDRGGHRPADRLPAGSVPDHRRRHRAVGTRTCCPTLPEQEARSLAGAVAEPSWTAVSDEAGAFGVPHHTDTPWCCWRPSRRRGPSCRFSRAWCCRCAGRSSRSWW